MLSFHQRSHSTPVGHAFINTTLERDQSPFEKLIEFKESSPVNTADNFFDAAHQSLGLYEEDEDNKTNRRCMVLLDCRMDRGFFYTSECHWTCYRRNYFQVTASFSVPGLVHQDRLILEAPNETVRIKGLFVRLRACTLDSPNKSVALTQMTAKRDKGPQREPPMVSVESEKNTVTFERLQFKMATANNGKKRATQQYFRLVVELLVQTENTMYTVSECYSKPLIVRGRSPGHYNADPLEPKRKRKYSEQDYNAQVLSHTRSHSVSDSIQKRIKPYQDSVGVTRALDHWRYQRQRTHEDYYVNPGFPSPFSPMHHPCQWPDIQFKHEEQ